MPNPVQLTSLSTEPRRDVPPIRIRHKDKAAYGVMGKGFFDDKCKFWPTGSALYFEGEPNLDLHPLNELAHERKMAFFKKLNECGEKMSKKTGKSYIPYEITEWVESADHEEMPSPKYVMGIPVKESEFNEAIR